MKIKFLTAADEFSADEWATLTGNTPAQMRDPFCSRVFLAAAENAMRSGDSPVGAGDTASLGWRAHHLCLTDDEDKIAALLPMYIRTMSFGDFSHDWSWSNAWASAGLSYYPKLVSGMPFTPSPGPRFLIRPDLSRAIWVAALVQAAIDETARLGISNWQCLFVDDDDVAMLVAAGLLMRRGVQFHWRNSNYENFDDFLAGFTADKRKKLKRERRAVAESGVQLQTLHGNEISEAMWYDIHRQYRDTFARHGNYPAFPFEFFVEVGAKLGRQLVVFVARENDRIIASAICYRDDQSLYGRHWGCDRTIPGLHFELCFYQGIEYCIAQGLQSFEPGAQGEHKLARGFTPVATWSGFWIADPRMRRAVGDFVGREDAAMQNYAEEASSHLPFRRAS